MGCELLNGWWSVLKWEDNFCPSPSPYSFTDFLREAPFVSLSLTTAYCTIIVRLSPSWVPVLYCISTVLFAIGVQFTVGCGAVPYTVATCQDCTVRLARLTRKVL